MEKEEYLCLLILFLLIASLIIVAGGYGTENYSTLNPNTTFASECGTKESYGGYEKIPTNYENVRMMADGAGVERDLYMKDGRVVKITDKFGKEVPDLPIIGVS